MKLLVVEGLDGAGKSTQIKLLNKFFSERGHSCEYLHFPRTDTAWFGELIARFLRGEFGALNEVDPWLVAMLYAGDRKDASGLITNWLNSGKIVLLDRYTYSNIAYQCAKLDNSEERKKLMSWILDLEFKHFGIPMPDLNIFLDVPLSFTEKKLSSVRRGHDREYLNGTKDIHEESMAFQKRVREIYIEVAMSNEQLAVINCSDKDGNMLSPREIFERIKTIIKEKKLI